MVNETRGDDSHAFSSHFTSSIGATAAAASAAAASAAVAAATTMCRGRARVSASTRPSAAAHVRGREEIEKSNDARGDAALAQLFRERARFTACVITCVISFRRRRRHCHRTP